MFLQKNYKNKNKLLTEINITPFVDILLVIMVIFMLVSPTIKQEKQLDISLPEGMQEQVNISRSSVIISINRKGIIFFNENKVNNKQLKSKLQNINKKTEVLIKADKTIKYAEVIKVMSLLQQLHLNNISLATVVN